MSTWSELINLSKQRHFVVGRNSLRLPGYQIENRISMRKNNFLFQILGSDFGTDPRAFIGWENTTKLVFFYSQLTSAGVSWKNYFIWMYLAVGFRKVYLVWFSFLHRFVEEKQDKRTQNENNKLKMNQWQWRACNNTDSITSNNTYLRIYWKFWFYLVGFTN